jgi:hypothetical protein
MSNLHNALRGEPISLSLRRMFGGDASLSVERLGETLQPVINPWDHPECRYLRGEVPFSASSTLGATAAEFTGVALRNPSSSNVIAVITEVSVAGAATMAFLGWGTSIASYGGTTTLVSRDRRVSGVPHLTCNHGSDTATQINGGVIERLQGAAAETRYFKAVPLVLIPGFVLIIENATVNLGLEFNYVGYARPVVTGELL